MNCKQLTEEEVFNKLVPQEEALNLIKSGVTLNYEDARRSVFMNIKNKVLETHKNACGYAITPPKSNNGKWQTYVRMVGYQNNRKKIIKHTEEELILALAEHYKICENKTDVTLEEYFNVWFEYDKANASSMNTVIRHNQYWNKYYKDTPIAKERLINITPIVLSNWANNLIKKFNLTSKEFGNLKVVISGCLKMAYLEELINRNPMDNIMINKRLFRVVRKKSNKQEVFLNDDFEKFIICAKEEAVNNKKSDTPYAILFNFYFGLRVSELVALKFTDIEDRYLKIQRMEIKTKDDLESKSYYKVVDYTKTRDKDNRHLYICDEAYDILKKIAKKRYNHQLSTKEIEQIDDYIFLSQGNRVNSRSVNTFLEKICKQANIPIKSSHKIRKTVASRLNSNNVPLDEIRKILGHTNLSTTLGYIYNPQCSKETERLLEKALSNNAQNDNTSNDACEIISFNNYFTQKLLN